jgi:hypothetical protein
LTAPLYSLKLGVRSHRLLWWLLAHQGSRPDGAATGTVDLPDWRKLAARDLRFTPACMWKATADLKNAGVISFRPYQKSVKINGEAFEA